MNTIHPYDAFVLRELDARCNYNVIEIYAAIQAIDHHLQHGSSKTNEKLAQLESLTKVFNFMSIRAIEFCYKDQMHGIASDYLIQLRDKCKEIVEYKPFPTKDIHDEFGCAPNNVNRMKYHYNHIMAETYQSTWIMDMIQVLTGDSYHHHLPPVDPLIVQAIKDNDYSIC